MAVVIRWRETRTSRKSVYVEAETLPGAIELSGAYRVEGAVVLIDVILVRDGETLERLEIRGDVRELENLAKEVVRRVLLAVDEMS